MKKERLAVLLGYFESQMDLIERIRKEVESTQPTDREKTSHLGYLLHNFYCALEELFQEVAKTFENRIEDLSRYHRELLQRMRLTIPGIRTNVLSEKSFPILDELRAFRHIFRHAYTYELDPERVHTLKLKVKRHWRLIRMDLDEFERFLKNTLDKEV